MNCELQLALYIDQILFSDTMLLSSKRSFIKTLFFNQTCSSIYFKTLEAVSQVQGEQREVETS